MSSITACDSSPDERPPSGEGSVTVTCEVTIRNGNLFSGRDVTWNWGTTYDGNVHLLPPEEDVTVTVPPNSTVTSSITFTFGNTGGFFLPEGRDVTITAVILDDQPA